MSSILKKIPFTRDRLRTLRVAIYSFTSCNTFLITASFSFFATSFSSSSSNLVYLIPQILIYIGTLFYCFLKTKYNANLSGWQLLLGVPLAGVYLYFAVILLIKLVSGADNVLFLFWVIESINVIIAGLILAEAFGSWSLSMDPSQSAQQQDAQQHQQRLTPSNSGQGDTTHPAIPRAVHLYQPRLSLVRPPRPSNVSDNHSTGGAGSSSSSHHSARATSTDGVVVIEGDDDLWLENDIELEELPKYQRRRPAQSATIIDLSNLASVDATVLSTVVLEGVRDPETRISLQSPTTEGSQDVVHDIIISDDEVDDTTAPEYSPPLPSSTPVPVPEVVVVAADDEWEAHNNTDSSTAIAMTTSTISSNPPATESAATPEPPVYVP
ncbi:hypothetical protein BGZ83_002085 [Gryganskiella cystojenkinii]|nr:hypothetical protein BGZ83_002085 [Gryganskiella cystojenkinii]